MKKKIYILLLGIVTGLSACSDWLDVQPETSIPGDVLFESEAGFKDVLTGFYLQMGQTDLYAENLTYGYLDAISGNYDTYTSSLGDIYDYDNTWLSVKDNVYRSMYNIIANINNFLKYIDQNRSVIKTEKYYELMKGEALGLRAFLHFDLLRLFGPVYSVNPTGKAIPYRLSFGQQATPVLPADQVITYVLKDLHEADSLLEVSDSKSLYYPIGNNYDAFVSLRQLRMNVYAVRAMLARVYLYKGDADSKARALDYAREVVGSGHFSLYKTDNNTEPVLGEYIFGLNVYELNKLLEVDGKYKTQIPTSGQLSTDGSYIMRTKENFDEQYETGSRGTYDIRANASAFINVLDRQRKSYKLCLKYDQSKYTSPYPEEGKNMLPLIRLPEMYYIIAECETDKEKSAEALNTVMWARGIAYEDGVIADDSYDNTSPDYDKTHTKRVNEIMKEYRKEFFSEGQLFYFYKRHNYKTFPYCVEENMADFYQWPLPDNEIIFGNNN